eukprot:9144595-Alexandrium_andersonii.AAC.1
MSQGLGGCALVPGGLGLLPIVHVPLMEAMSVLPCSGEHLWRRGLRVGRRERGQRSGPPQVWLRADSGVG